MRAWHDKHRGDGKMSQLQTSRGGEDVAVADIKVKGEHYGSGCEEMGGHYGSGCERMRGHYGGKR